jgi:hypothetical protein
VKKERYPALCQNIRDGTAVSADDQVVEYGCVNRSFREKRQCTLNIMGGTNYRRARSRYRVAKIQPNDRIVLNNENCSVC